MIEMGRYNLARANSSAVVADAVVSRPNHGNSGGEGFRRQIRDGAGSRSVTTLTKKVICRKRLTEEDREGWREEQGLGEEALE